MRSRENSSSAVKSRTLLWASPKLKRYYFNRHTQEPGDVYDQFRKVLRKLEKGYEFETITADKILWDRLVFGIKDDKLIRETTPWIEIVAHQDKSSCASECMIAQIKKEFGDGNCERCEKKYCIL